MTQHSDAISIPELPDLPPLRLVMTTPSGTPVPGFTAAGEDALSWWHRLRAAHAESGYWPVLMDRSAPEYFGSVYSGPPESSEELNGAGILAERGEDRLQTYGDFAETVRAELAGESPWPETARRPGFSLPFGAADEPFPVTVALVKAAAGWQIPEVLQYGAWNYYPSPAEHAAILRYWHERYGADLVVLTGTTAEFWVARPPRTPAEALALAWEYMVYNDGDYDLYGADNLTELAAGLIGASVWLAWWD